MVRLVAFTHIWIALGAVGAAAATVLTQGYTMGNWDRFTWAGLTGIGIATGCIYTLQRRIKLLKNPSGIPRGRRVSWNSMGTNWPSAGGRCPSAGPVGLRLNGRDLLTWP